MQSHNSKNEGHKTLISAFVKNVDRWDIYSLLIVLSLIEFAAYCFKLLPGICFRDLCVLLLILFSMAIGFMLIEIEIKRVV